MKKALLLMAVLQMSAYDLPDTLNLGFNNILEGGPIRPTGGFYWYQYVEFYTTKNFKNSCGQDFGHQKSPRLNSLFGCSEFIYQSYSKPFLNAQAGIDVQLYYALYSKIQKNDLGFSTSGSGISDPYIGLFLQWEPLMKGDREFLVHRFELGASFPAGKFKRASFFNPGNGCYYINPSWSATFFLSRKWSVSTVLNYVWSSQKKYTQVQPGQAIYVNYSMEYEALHNFWVSVCGYYLQQITDSKIKGIKTPGRKEQVFAVGPGVLYSVSDDLFFFAYAYFESLVKNRSKGVSLLLRSVVHF